MAQENKQITNDEVVILPNIIKPRAYHRCINDVGSNILVRAKLSQKDGKKIAEPGDKLDLYAYIQAQVASTDMASIVARVNAGDMSAINVNPNGGFYGDATLLPKDIMDVQAMNRIYDDARANFGKLQPEVQALFDNDPSKFLNAVISKQFDGIVKEYEAKKQPNKGDGGVDNG